MSEGQDLSEEEVDEILDKYRELTPEEAAAKEAKRAAKEKAEQDEREHAHIQNEIERLSRAMGDLLDPKAPQKKKKK